jgi:hypothetical protein
VVAADPAAFAVRYGAALLQSEYGANWLTTSGYTGHLNNGGEKVTLTAPIGGDIQNFNYDPAWYPLTAGQGFSLTVCSATQPLALWDSAAGWQPSGTPGGTPGTADGTWTPPPGSVVINEVLAHPTTPGGDMVELYNTSFAAIDISGWFLSDDASNLMKYQIHDGTVLQSGAYLVLTQAAISALARATPGRWWVSGSASTATTSICRRAP